MKPFLIRRQQHSLQTVAAISVNIREKAAYVIIDERYNSNKNAVHIKMSETVSFHV